MKTKTPLLAILFALATFCLFASPPSGDWLTWLGNNSGQDATGAQSEFFGAKAGQNATDIYRSVFLGIMAGYGSWNLSNCFALGAAAMANATNCDNCVFVGPYAGQRANGVSYRTQINGQLYVDKARDEFYVSPDPAKPSVRAPLSYSSGTMRVNANFAIETTAANRLAFESADAHVWLSAFDGDDVNDGLSPTGAVRSIIGAYNAAYRAVTNGTLNASNEIVVAVAEGVYAPVLIKTWGEPVITNGIAFVATGDRNETILDGASAPPRNQMEDDTPMFCGTGFPFTMTGWTITRFNRNSWYGYSSSTLYAITGGIKFKRCDITGNHGRKIQYGWLSGEFEDCDIHGNSVRGKSGEMAYSAFGSWDRQYITMRRCHVWDNDFSQCAYLFWGRYNTVDHCLFEVDFYISTHPPAFQQGGYNTIIAKTYSNPNEEDSSTIKNFGFRTNSFIVVAAPGPGYDESIYGVGDSCVVSNANLTADFVAADANCPSVRSDGQPDYGYRDSGLWQYKSASAAIAMAVESASNNFVRIIGEAAGTVTNVAATAASNAVESVLAPRTVEWHYGEQSVTNAVMLPNWATSAWRFVRDDDASNGIGQGVANLYSNGKLRNYSLLVEGIPPEMPYVTMDYSSLRDKGYRFFASPEMYDFGRDVGGMDGYGWVMVSNDVPCVITVREPEAGTLIVQRQRLNNREAYISIENDEPVIYTND